MFFRISLMFQKKKENHRIETTRRWVNNEDEINNVIIFNFSWTIPLIPAETIHECLFSRLSSHCQLPGLSTAYRKRLECHATITPFFESIQKASITLSTHGVSEMNAGSCRGLIPCTENIDFSNNETKAISAPPPLYCILSHTAGFISSVSLQSDWDGAGELKMVFCRFCAFCSRGHFWFVIYLWRYRPHAQWSVLSEF